MNVSPRNNDHALTLRLPKELYSQLRARAEAEERTVAWLLRRLARQYLNGVDNESTDSRPDAWDGAP